MTLLLYEHVAENGQIVDPYSWRIRLALAHMGIKVKRVPISLYKFRETFIKDKLTNLPTIIDGIHKIETSWEVATYLERNFPNSPSLFGGEVGTHLAKFIHSWAEHNLLKHLYALMGDRVYEILDPSDKELFEEFLSIRFNLRWDLLRYQREEKILTFRKSLGPFRLTMLDRPFLCGELPAYADFILYGPLKWGDENYQGTLLESGDLISLWKSRMDQLFSHLWPDNKDIFV